MDRNGNTFSQIAYSIKGEAALVTQELSEAEKRVLNMSESTSEPENESSVEQAESTIVSEIKDSIPEPVPEDTIVAPEEEEKISAPQPKEIENREEYEHKTRLVSTLDKARNLADDESDYLPDIPQGGKLIGSVIDESVMEPEPPAKPRKRLHLPKFSFVILIPLFILLMIYVAGVVYFSSHYEPRTFIGSIDCGMLDRQESMEAIEGSMSTFEIFLAGREGFNSTIMASDINALGVYDKAQLDESLNIKTAVVWPIHCILGRNIAISTQVDYDSELLTKAISEAPIMDSRIARKPENARLGFNEATHSMEVVPEDRGCLPDKNAIFNVIAQKLTSLEAGERQLIIDLDEQNCYVEPQILSTDDNLNRIAKEADAMARTRVVYDWNGNEVVVDGTLIAEWIKYEGSKVILDESKVAEFVENTANTYDTYNQPFLFRTTNGKRVSIERHEYGWRTDIEAETQALIEHIHGCDDINKEPAYAYKGYSKGLDDIGTSYVEIDLGAQHLYLYENGVITLDTDFVSGGPPNGDFTPDGIYGVTYKTTNAVLRGPGYETPVTYWMPFNGGIGMHDAYWRSEFGGEVYKHSGSHGCVNLPPKAAKSIYEVVCPNFPVVCYW